MAEANLGDHLLYDLKKILLGSLAYLPSRQCRGRMGDKKYAKAFLDGRVPNDHIDMIGQVHDLFQARGADTKDFSHLPSVSSNTT